MVTVAGGGMPGRRPGVMSAPHAAKGASLVERDAEGVQLKQHLRKEEIYGSVPHVDAYDSRSV